ncbi:hypothetical protein AB1H94_07875 [Pseudomonas fulva]|uniref:hypothetical protein n=1 Tax=Pseudomonas TaxID=286 RepID=UPI0011B05483|nr:MULTISPECIES: hypothetical protein [Pseudomonas]
MEEIIKEVESAIVAFLDQDQEFYTKLLLEFIDESRLPQDEAIRFFCEELSKHLRVEIPVTLVAT